MYIKELHINAFGPLVDAHLTFDRGLNIIEGRNESGKSSVAMFIKFIFYGLSARAGDAVSERRLYINWSRSVASGHAVIVVDTADGEKEIRIERAVASRSDAEGKIKYSERLKVLDHATGMPLTIKGQPGEHFFGVPEQVFLSSAFAAQGADVRPDSAAVKEAVENIILAADENVSVKRAVDAIEKARVRLMHKKGTGGEIHDLEEKRDAVEESLMASRDSSARLIKAELSLADVKGNIESAKARCATLEQLSAVLEQLSRESVRDRADETEAELKKVTEKLEQSDFTGADESFRSSLAVAIRDMEKRDKLSAEYKEKSESIRENFPEGEVVDPSEDEEYAEKMMRRGANVTVPAVIALVLGLAAFGASFLLKGGSSLYLPVFCASALLVMTGAAMFILASAWKHEAKAVLEDWSVNNMEEFREAVATAREMYRSLEKERLAAEGATAAGEDAESTLELLALSAKLDAVKDESPRELARRLVIYSAECTKNKKALEGDKTRLEAQLVVHRSTLAEASDSETVADDELRRTAESMSDEEKRGVARELQFTRTKLENLRGRELDLERECSALRAISVSPSAAAEQLEALNGSIAEKKATLDSYVLAAEAIRAASENIRLSVVPRLTDAASGIMARVTDGRYGEIGVTTSFDMSFRSDETGTMELDFLSAGTREAAYVALRLALVNALFESDRRPPVILDESLCSLDEVRVREATLILAESGCQVFLFSCRTLEGSLDIGTKTVMGEKR